MHRVGLGIITMALGLMAAQDPAFEWNDRGLEASTRGDYPEAERLFDQAVQRWRLLGPGFEAHLATSLLNQAQAICSQGRRAEGAALMEQSLALFRKSRGPRDERTLTALNLLAGVDAMLGEYDRSEVLLQEAFQTADEYFPETIHHARAMAGLAAIRTHNNRLDEALPLAERALDIVLKTEGEDSLDAALTYAGVAEIHREAHRNDRALPLYRKARAIYEKLLGPQHPRVASVLGQEGLILMSEGKLSLAERDMKTCLQILAESCPACVFEKWISETNLGLLRMAQKKYDEAYRLFTDVLDLQEKTFRKPGPEMATTLQLLSSVRQRQRRFDDAARLSKRADLILSYR